jgi:hypothetical protein
MTQVSEEVVVPPTVESSLKEKALVPDSQKVAEGVPAKENEGQTSAPMPSASEKVKRPLAPLKPIDENAPASDDVHRWKLTMKIIGKIPRKRLICSLLDMAQMVLRSMSNFICRSLRSLGSVRMKEKGLHCHPGSGLKSKLYIMLGSCLARIEFLISRY